MIPFCPFFVDRTMALDGIKMVQRIVRNIPDRKQKGDAHRVVGILEVGILGQKWNHDILFLIQFLVPKGIQLRFWQWKIIKKINFAVSI